ncbi:MAG: GNAT family N-acetyltransferase [Planctomycetota bacterium]
MAWWVETWDEFKGRTAAENLAHRERLCAQGEHDGYLLYVGDQPVAWCQVGPRDRLLKLRRQHGLDEDPAAWAISCLLVVPARRRQGLARALLREVLAALRLRGARVVEAFPRRAPEEGDEQDPLELWTGPEELYREAGFEVWRDDPERPVLRLILGARSE